MRHVPAASTHANANQYKACSAGIGQKRRGGSDYVSDLGKRVFKLARLAAAFTERAMIECERQKATFSQCRSVSPGRLLLDAGQGAGEHGACTRLAARGLEQVARDRCAVNLEWVATGLRHGALLPVTDRTPDGRAPLSPPGSPPRSAWNDRDPAGFGRSSVPCAAPAVWDATTTTTGECKKGRAAHPKTSGAPRRRRHSDLVQYPSGHGRPCPTTF